MAKKKEKARGGLGNETTSDRELRYCDLKPQAPVELAPDISGDRARAIVTLSDKWANNTQLRYYFFTDEDKDGEEVVLRNGDREWRTWVGDEPQRKVVRNAFTTWKKIGIGLEFEETKDRDEAEIRIGFMQGDGSWSYLGTQILEFGSAHRTMNFGWNIRQDADTALHEIGHTLGLPHEHQNPNAGIVWNEEAVYDDLAGHPNFWSRQKTHHNIIRKISPDKVQGSNWDPESIMHYPFKPGLIRSPKPYDQGIEPKGGLSPRDVAWVKTFYPAPEGTFRTLTPMKSEELNLTDGQQTDFLFECTATNKYKIMTFGACDTQIVVFEEVGGKWRYLTADDDSGEDRNAMVNPRLRSDRRYAIRVRLKFTSGGPPPSVMIW